MSFTILASVSVLALVSNARPLPVPSLVDELRLSTSGPTDIHSVVQTVLKSRVGGDKIIEECLDCDETTQVHLLSDETVQEYLSQVDHESLKALVHLDGSEFHSPDEKELIELLNRLESENGRRTPVPDDAIDSLTNRISSDVSETSDPEEKDLSPRILDSKTVPQSEIGEPPSVQRMAIALLSAFVALLALGCIVAVVYAAEIVRSALFQSRTAWKVLPALRKKLDEQVESAPGVDVVAFSQIDMEKSESLSLVIPAKHRSPLPQIWIESPSAGKEEGEKVIEDEMDEKFYDANSDSGADSSAYCTPCFPSTELPSLDEKPQANPAEARQVPSPVTSRPSWSIRATEAKLPTVDPKTVSRGRRRAAAAPEIDVALAMQLRPGLGIGADAAWLVRFVMTLLGWCAVLISGGRR